MELARGKVEDRPWGRTFGALALRGITAQLTLVADGKSYRVAFHGGAVVGAQSPLASDAAVRIALTSNLISSSQVAEIGREITAAPTRDEIDVIVERARLGPDQALRLRRRTVAQRAARSFAIERGEFVIDDQVTIPTVPGSELDPRAVIYLGARQNLAEGRLAVELGQIGAWFQLRPEAVEDLGQFGFAEADHPILAQLLVGADLVALEQLPGIEPRMVRAVLYALASFNACVVEAVARGGAIAPRPTVRPPSNTDAPTQPRVPIVRAPTPTPTAPPVASAIDDDAVTLKPTLRKRSSSDQVVSVRRRMTNTPPAQIEEIQKLIAARVQLLDRRADHFAMLGVPHEATSDEIRTAFFGLARQLHPDKLAAMGIVDDARGAHRLFAQVNTAFAVLGDPARRYDYLQILARGGEDAVRAEQAKAEALAMRALDAEDAYRRGEMLLRRDQLGAAIGEFKRALELDPETADYQGMLAWAQFCASPDKMAASQATRAALERAVQLAPKAPTSRFLLGRVERMLGRDQEAQRVFKEVLRVSPGHTEASSELRVIESRLAQATAPKKPR
ncbi:MAG: J domain-containing protein [Proteobacteria bacterium]|nr:J domain-containing protein [Pseudomonadota bacterium]